MAHDVIQPEELSGKKAVIYNSRLLKFCDNYAREKYANVDLEAAYRKAGVRKYEIDDPGHWFSQSQCDEFYRALIVASGNTDFPREAGRYVIRSKAMWSVRQFILGTVSTAAFFESLERNYSKVSLGIVASAKVTGKESAEMLCLPVKGIKTQAYQCDVSTGILEAVGLLFTNTFATVKHTECVHKGGEVCRFEISWKAAPSVIWRRMRNRFFVATVPAIVLMGLTFSTSSALLGGLAWGAFLGALSFASHHKREEELLNIIEAQGVYAGDLAEDDNIRNKHSLLIKSISQEASLTDTQDGVAEGVITVMTRHLDYDRTAICYLRDDRLNVASFMGYSSAQVRHIEKYGTQFRECEPFRNVVLRRENISLNGDQNLSESGVFGSGFPNASRIESLMAVPLNIEGELVGFLLATNVKGSRPLTQGDLSLLIGVASQVGLSIDNVNKSRELADGELRYRRQVQDGIEEERRRIAFDLHDHVAQDLGSLMIKARMIQERMQEGEGSSSEEFQVFVSVLKGSIDSVRNIAYDLQPPSLAEFGLIHTLRVYAEDYRDNTEMDVDFGAAGLEEVDLDYDIMINLFRIVQESLTNIYKHACAERVVIRIVYSHPYLILRVRDDGRGFMPGLADQPDAHGRQMGLRNMAERARLMNGSFRISTSPGRGCEVALEVPLMISAEPQVTAEAGG